MFDDVRLTRWRWRSLAAPNVLDRAAQAAEFAIERLSSRRDIFASLLVRRLFQFRTPHDWQSRIASRTMSLRHDNDRTGFTLTELICVLAVIGVLVSLTAPAVMQALAAARRTQCTNNLRQIGVALGSFEAQHREYPSVFCGIVDQYPDVYDFWCVSPHAQLASHLDAGPEAAEIHAARQPSRWDLRPLGLAAPVVWRCPEDGRALERASNYRFNRGLVPMWPGDPLGVFTSFRAKTAANVQDGLSHTAFVSERIIGSEAGNDWRRDPRLVTVPRTSDGADVPAACAAVNQSGLPPISAFPPSWGTNWLSGEMHHAVYYHFLPPNSAWQDCLPERSAGRSLSSARSLHAHGVHTLFGDGHVQFVGNSIDLAVWRAWGTRDEHETIQ
jgi:prepilin-type N-terminal cleavage/methylation domain-containing protein/prepilin-type processing-associated H-X9-DG protein